MAFKVLYCEQLVNRCNQSFLLQQREVVPYCNCLNCKKESLCLLSYNKKNPKHILKFMLKANQNGEEDDDDDEDYDIHEDGIHVSYDYLTLLNDVTHMPTRLPFRRLAIWSTLRWLH